MSGRLNLDQPKPRTICTISNFWRAWQTKRQGSSNAGSRPPRPALLASANQLPPSNEDYDRIRTQQNPYLAEGRLPKCRTRPRAQIGSRSAPKNVERVRSSTRQKKLNF